jgi:hypothetical protein
MLSNGIRLFSGLAALAAGTAASPLSSATITLMVTASSATVTAFAGTTYACDASNATCIYAGFTQRPVHDASALVALTSTVTYLPSNYTNNPEPVVNSTAVPTSITGSLPAPLSTATAAPTAHVNASIQVPMDSEFPFPFL